MIIDKLGQIVKCKDRIAVAQLKANNSFKLNINSVLVFATVLFVNNEHNTLHIKYDIGEVDNYFESKEFIIINDNSKNIYTELENATFNLVGL